MASEVTVPGGRKEEVGARAKKSRGIGDAVRKQCTIVVVVVVATVLWW